MKQFEGLAAGGGAYAQVRAGRTWVPSCPSLPGTGQCPADRGVHPSSSRHLSSLASPAPGSTPGLSNWRNECAGSGSVLPGGPVSPQRPSTRKPSDPDLPAWGAGIPLRSREHRLRLSPVEPRDSLVQYVLRLRPCFQMGKLRHAGVRSLAHGHSASSGRAESVLLPAHPPAPGQRPGRVSWGRVRSSPLRTARS